MFDVADESLLVGITDKVSETLSERADLKTVPSIAMTNVNTHINVTDSLSRDNITGINSTVCSNKKTLADITHEGNWKPQRTNNEWITVQRKRLKNRFIGKCGTATSESDFNFKAAEIKVPIFIYNVAKEVAASDIVNYIKMKTSMRVDVDQINAKMPKDYGSFKINVPKHTLQLFLQDEFWPQGISFRRFIEFRPKKL